MSSDQVIRQHLSRRGILLAFVGPSGSGKTTFCRMLRERFSKSTQFSVSATSRPKREGEVSGRDYHFLSREEFEERLSQGSFFEWEETHGHYYGTLRETIDDAIHSGKDLLLDIDIRGALRIRKEFPDDAVVIFFLPPSFAEMKKRLEARGDLSAEAFATRVKTSEFEYAKFLEVAGDAGGIDYCLVNDDLEETYAKVEAILVSERLKVQRMDKAELEKMCLEKKR